MCVYWAQVYLLLGGGGCIGEDKTVVCLRADKGVDGRIEEGHAEQQLRA